MGGCLHTLPTQNHVKIPTYQHTHMTHSSFGSAHSSHNSKEGGRVKRAQGGMAAAGMAGEVLLVREWAGGRLEEPRWRADQISCHLMQGGG